MLNLDHLLEISTPILRGVARYYHRRSWGLHVLQYEDYLQEAYATAIDIHHHHHRKGLERCKQMVRRGAIYRCQRLWRRELLKVTSHIDLGEVDLSEVVAEPLASSLLTYYTRETVEQIRQSLTGLRRAMFDVLLDPGSMDIDYRFCRDLYRDNPSKPIQRGELVYLASYFRLTRRQVLRELNGLRNDCDHVFEGGIA